MDTHQYHINYDRLNDCISEKLTTYYKYQFVERQFIYIEFLGNCLLQTDTARCRVACLRLKICFHHTLPFPVASALSI